MKLIIDYNPSVYPSQDISAKIEIFKDDVYLIVTKPNGEGGKYDSKKVNTFLNLCDAANCMMKICGGKVEINIDEQGHIGQVICFCKSIHTFEKEEDATRDAIALLVRDCDSMDLVAVSDQIKLIFWLKM